MSTSNHSAANVLPMNANILVDALERQQAAYAEVTVPSIAERRADLKKLKAMINDHREAIIAAIIEDYGSRSRHEILMSDIITVTDSINHTIKQLKQWAKPQRRHVDWTVYPGARGRVIPQPLGCVGIIVPWNFPVFLSFGPLTAAFAAGNRALVKMSENSRALSRLLIQISDDYFPPEKLAFFEETGSVGIEFSKLPFDLLFFTGSGATGRKVMAAAAENLTPVVLELGGKSPAVIDPNYPMAKAVDRILYAKQFNAGQLCVNVDYVFVHHHQVDQFVTEAKNWAAEHVPDIHSPDYSSVIDDHAFQRLQATLTDAREKGATVISLNPEQAADPASRKLPVQLVLDSKESMTIRQRETFGPILLVRTYDAPQEIIDYQRGQDAPLAFYPFSNDKQLVASYIEQVMSGGVAVNDALHQVPQHDLPFGGVGASGMGQYHGREGFETFSKMRPVFYQGRVSTFKLLQPPYGRLANWIFSFMTWFKR